ncbi:MAG: permease-like cell division protein FtsX [Erysipelotrichaceae bacterium]|nr:permease-like cell division protein FtsX [Erysipelotrichaceae bacterium]
MKIIRRFFRKIKEGFIGVGRHFGMAISSSASVTITLLLIGFFLTLTYNLNTITQDIESSISLSALVDYDITSKTTLDSLEKQILAIDGVLSVDYRSKDEEFTYYVEMYPDIREFNELYREQNPFHDAYLVSVKDGTMLETVKNRISGINGIASVHDGGSNTYLLIDLLQKVRIFGAALVLSLTLLAVYLIYNTISITIRARDTEIWIMKNVGATNGYIRGPFMVEGVIIGILGSIIPIACMIAGYLYLYNMSNGVILGVFTLTNPKPFLYYLCAVLAGIGIVVGYIGSFLSVNKLLRSKR